ncbi:hypothetical protein RirG_157020 [Rhizophagus irregularis DAOM 197198w]|uniref:Uncharacterized protein n=1 Tax=Rhizophagus irregularis (strain DAOM 197198w) TaxID=1432141 RepID=A0A015K642_RHIIW|nr:hypothetical protein RirG_157020 [Rhizophagus irregularis DAOM 197198w]
MSTFISSAETLRVSLFGMSEALLGDNGRSPEEAKTSGCGGGISDQEFESPNYNEPIFICNYPTSSFITIIYYEVNGKRHERSYNILSLGEYPSNVKYTQRGKKNSVVYKIPNAYKVETILGGFQIICESNYLPNGKIKYSIEWKDNNNVSKIISNTRSSSGVANDFYKQTQKFQEFYCLALTYLAYEARENITNTPIINRKRPYTEISTSQQNRRLNLLAKDFKTQSSIILKNNNINNSQLRLIELEIGGEVVVIDFRSHNNLDFMVHCDAILRAIDECLISRDGYRRLAMVDPRIEREYRIEGRKHYINEVMNSLIPIYDYIIKIPSSPSNQSKKRKERENDNIEDLGSSSNSALLDILVPIWKKGSSSILTPGDTDGHIVTHQYSHVMFTYPVIHCISIY